MEKEIVLSGYCRCTDAKRMVILETDDGKLLDVDCNFVNCPYQADCAVAENIRACLK